MPFRAPDPPGFDDLGNGLLRGPDGALHPVRWLDTFQEAFDKGRRARLRPWDSPPYPEGSEQRVAWLAGLGDPPA